MGQQLHQPTHWKVISLFFFFSPLSEKQKLNAENYRMSSVSTWNVLDPTKFMDTEPLTTACLCLPRLTPDTIKETTTLPVEYATSSALEETT
jgi:hypothetical protein